MARFIKPIPTLTGAAAERFNAIARENEANRGSIDFSKQMETMREIMRKSGYYSKQFN